jgi:hypothetical protein
MMFFGKQIPFSVFSYVGLTNPLTLVFSSECSAAAPKISCLDFSKKEKSPTSSLCVCVFI